jgi:hypothetical protein
MSYTDQQPEKEGDGSPVDYKAITRSLGVELNQAKIPEGESQPLLNHESRHGSLMVELDQPTKPR